MVLIYTKVLFIKDTESGRDAYETEKIHDSSPLHNNVKDTYKMSIFFKKYCLVYNISMARTVTIGFFLKSFFNGESDAEACIGKGY